MTKLTKNQRKVLQMLADGKILCIFSNYANRAYVVHEDSWDQVNFQTACSLRIRRLVKGSDVVRRYVISRLGRAALEVEP